MTHYLKCRQPFFDDVLLGRKNFEVRKDDRNFNVKDLVVLWEVDKWGVAKETTTGAKTIIYILRHEDFPEGIQPGYCVLGLK